MIHKKQLGYYNYLIVGNCALRLDQMAGVRWDEKLGEVVAIQNGGRQYQTGFRDKAAFDAYLEPKPKKGKKKGEKES